MHFCSSMVYIYLLDTFSGLTSYIYLMEIRKLCKRNPFTSFWDVLILIQVYIWLHHYHKVSIDITYSSCYDNSSICITAKDLEEGENKKSCLNCIPVELATDMILGKFISHISGVLNRLLHWLIIRLVLGISSTRSVVGTDQCWKCCITIWSVSFSRFLSEIIFSLL